ncbi:hypothetical protein ACPYO6_10640 [Georgenia sp. Z1344]|uniref:hypothetical protein n=1 Tax=Georgenia sp. Z1344 TaxID=3416706 RepID=UPI003CE7EAC0
MGIRYYAYAFDASRTQRALADPYSVIGADPLADAWGLVPFAGGGSTNFQRSVPKRDLLCLDKAWSELQAMTAGPGGSSSGARPAYRMFEGAVRWTELGWDAWVRAITPSEADMILPDLRRLVDSYVPVHSDPAVTAGGEIEKWADYVGAHLDAAHEFVDGVVRDGRGFAYLIG